MPDLAVETRGLTRRFGERNALDGVDVEVRAGEIFGLLGPNGGGKSTLFRILSTLLPPSRGSARVFGRDVVGEAAAVRASIGVVFQAPSLDKKLTVAENLRHQGHLYGLSGAPLRTRSGELLARFGLADRAKDLVGQLSGGLARRVEIAKGMIHRPRLLLLDEPSTGLDPGARRDLWVQLSDIRDGDGTTCLLTTHILEEAEGCDRIAILDHGERIALGTPRELEDEIPGDVITVEATEAAAVRTEIAAHFGIEARILGAAIRFETEDGPAIAAGLTERFGPRITSVTIGRPTLEDVFLARTGHAFRTPEVHRV